VDSNYQIMEVLGNMSEKDFRMHGQIPPTRVTSTYQYRLEYEHAPVFICGRYNKYVRNLSQTPWSLNDEPVTLDCVEQFISKPIKDRSTNFVSSGREDIDVRMLGEGRPFFLEITNPHKILLTYDDFRKIEETINSNADIRVSRLQFITKKQTSVLKDGETSKQKVYRCVVWTAKDMTEEYLHNVLDKVNNMELKQNTPVRVLHRRSLAERKKTIAKLAVKCIAPHFILLDVWASAGTYIKEFVHGDLGRTTPSLGSLLQTEADITQLDVLEIEMNFPPVPVNSTKPTQR
ncbi:hypothetical protein SAMD00019534_083470, partial [Acytostelium subglobosum LB1]|uniref:hypothetical protein n=1 Tax=Acytostelium subglobosum LB1 TaxID=1410327 RepID=UPI000644BDCD